VNTVETIFHHARHHPTALAFCAPGTRYNIVSYGRLTVFINNVARHAIEAGLKRGDIVAIVVSDPIVHWAMILGLERIGVVTISAQSFSLPATVGLAAVLTDRTDVTTVPGRLICIDERWLEEGNGPTPSVAVQHDGSALARLIMTSGSTGEPKAVPLTHDLIMLRAHSFGVVWGNRVAPCSRTFVDVGVAANIGYLWPAYVLTCGGAVFLRGSDAAQTMQSFNLYNVQCMVAAPSGMAEFLDYYERSPAFACPFEVMVSVGSMLARPLAERIRMRMCSHLVSGYGATEGNPVASAPMYQIAHVPGAVGYIVPGMEVEAVDDSDRPVGTDEEGLIRFRGQRCVSGYFGDTPDPEFRGGWFYPGDIGRVTADNILIVSGRKKVIIDVGGDKISPQAIEAVLLSFPGVVHAAAFSRLNPLGLEEAWAAVSGRADLNTESLKAFCAAKLAQPFVPARIALVDDMPHNAAGKVDKTKLLKILGLS
jgi:acyl-CoA synthetase (AMP-forming)/AMP-acid ligase II